MSIEIREPSSQEAWMDASTADATGVGLGCSIGPYKLLQVLGEGGFGMVYMAEQKHPVHRRVALKVIKMGMDTKQVIARFEAERQALAMMDHSNIAKVLDAGATDTGRPYFVMELVKGVPITEYCDVNNLSAKERLVLFMLVCHAVQHAHQKGIIHRDIKPSNVMIAMHDGKPVPKVIDFGIAKAIDQKLTEKTVFTEMRQLIGTPEYMSPEQAEMSGLDIDTRSDIYSLGVLLYELLTGTTPFDSSQLRQAAYGEFQRIIREVEPPKPSTRLSTMGNKLEDVAKHRSLEPRSLCKLLRGDLDWIVMKCLEKDRTRRYETANGLAMEILRYLCDEPVTASPPNFRYRAVKFVLRNRRVVASAMLIAIILVTSLIGTMLLALRESNARAEAEKQRDQAMLAQADLALMLALINRPFLNDEARSDQRPMLEECLAIYERSGPVASSQLAATLYVLGREEQDHGNKVAAAAHYTNAITRLKALAQRHAGRLIFDRPDNQRLSASSFLGFSKALTIGEILEHAERDLSRLEEES